MKVELTEAQANALVQAAEYKLELEPDGDGIKSQTDRNTMLRAIKALCDVFGWTSRFTA